MSKRVQYCGVALVGFDAEFYPEDDAKAVADEIAEAARAALSKWRTTIGERLAVEKLEQVEIEVFCLPLPSAEGFPRGLPQGDGVRRMSLADLQAWLLDEGIRTISMKSLDAQWQRTG